MGAKEAFHPKALVSGYIGTEKFVKPVQFLYQYVRNNKSPAKQGDRFTCRSSAAPSPVAPRS